jgi:uncharacterized protein with NAD-binding domain and iron-sulfur cluster
MQRRTLLRLLGVGASQAWLGCQGPRDGVAPEVSGQTEALSDGLDASFVRDPARFDGGLSDADSGEAPSETLESGRVIVLGGGVAGMTVAHELAERGFQVSVYELRDIAGGKARSMGKPGSGIGGRKDLPGEHGFRFFPGFYRHLPDTMKRIPAASGSGTVFDQLVPATRFLLSQAGVNDALLPVQQKNLGDLLAALTFVFGPNVTHVPWGDLLFFFARIQTWLGSCDARRMQQYERMSWWDFIQADSHSEAFRKFLAGGLTRTLVAANARHMSARSAASVLVQLLEDLSIGQGGMDRVLNGPTNEVWMDPWLAQLRKLGVNYNTDARVESLEFSAGRVQAAHVTRKGKPYRVEGELFVCALPVNVTRDLITAQMRVADPAFEGLSRLHTEWMNGIQFYLDRDIPVVNGHITFFDSPWALTAVSQKQFWSNVDLSSYGDGSVRGILSVDISDWNTPGILYGRPACECTRQEIQDEVWAQLSAHWDRDVGAIFRSARVVDVHLDPSITFAGYGNVDNAEPLLVNTVGSYYDRPSAITAISNFFLAGDYVRTHTDLATMESANESARRAVNGILSVTGSSEKRCAIWPLSEPDGYDGKKLTDQLLYALGLPAL